MQPEKLHTDLVILEFFSLMLYGNSTEIPAGL